MCRWIAALSFCIVACESVPLLPALTPEQRAAIDRQPAPHWTAKVQCGDAEGAPPPNCPSEMTHWLLESTGWISRAPEGEVADLQVTVVVRDRPRHSDVPTHNPVFAVLAIALPFWWADSFGFEMTVRRTDTGQEVPVSTFREGTRIVWGIGTPFINLLPDRGLDFPNRWSRDPDHVKLQLLPLLPSVSSAP